MQEFTIPTSRPQPQTNQQSQGNNPIPDDPSTPPTNVMPAAQVMTTQNPPVPIQTTPKNGLNKRIILKTMAAGILTAIISSFAFISFTSKEEPETYGFVKGETTSLPTKVVTDVPSSLKDTIFYTDSYNIFSAKLDGSLYKQLTSFSDEIEIHEIELINENYIGFLKCKNNLIYPSCEIFTVNLGTQEVNTIRKAEAGDLLELLTWVDESNYLYSVFDRIGNRTKIILKLDDTEREIVSLESGTKERERFIEDDTQLRLSPDNDKFYYINTFGNTGFDFVTYIYDLDGNVLDQIENATNPTWKDNDTVVYRKYSNSDTGSLYTRDITTRTSTRIPNTPVAAYGPKVLKDRLVFWEAVKSGKSYLSNFKDQYNYKENRAYPTWLSGNEIIYAKTTACNQDECNDTNSYEYETQFLIEEFFIYEIDTNTEKEIILGNLNEGIITWYDKHLSF